MVWPRTSQATKFFLNTESPDAMVASGLFLCLKFCSTRASQSGLALAAANVMNHLPIGRRVALFASLEMRLERIR